MYEKFLTLSYAIARHESAPYLTERYHYLEHCAARGDTKRVMRNKCDGLYWAAHILDPFAESGVTEEQLLGAVSQWAAEQQIRSSCAQKSVVSIARPWLRFLGWWQDPKVVVPFEKELNQYCQWLDTERGLTPSTIDQWRRRTCCFMQWCGSEKSSLTALQPTDIDQYLMHGHAKGWCRSTTAAYVNALRSFFRYAEVQGWCRPKLASTLQSPRIYQDESLPAGPSWADVQRLLEMLKSNRPQGIRNYAIALLLAVYGLRTSEVTNLRLQDIDWENERLVVPRVKRRAPQSYPLVASVGNSIAQYLQEVRPAVEREQVFLGMRPPHNALTQGALYAFISPCLKQLGCTLSHWGPHALRHACARHLISNELSLKEIGDHLGHRSASATRVYAKVNLQALKDVAAFDLGDL